MACNPADEETATMAPATPSASAPVTTAADASSVTPVNPNNTSISVLPPVTQVAPPPINMGSVSNPNPAHGQPGHRCDISVGAPLPPTGAPNAAVPVQPPVQMNGTPPPPVMLNTPSTAGKMVNPAHGLPGHRCEIAVGAPLN